MIANNLAQVDGGAIGRHVQWPDLDGWSAGYIFATCSPEHLHCSCQRSGSVFYYVEHSMSLGSWPCGQVVRSLYERDLEEREKVRVLKSLPVLFRTDHDEFPEYWEESHRLEGSSFRSAMELVRETSISARMRRRQFPFGDGFALTRAA